MHKGGGYYSKQIPLIFWEKAYAAISFRQFIRNTDIELKLVHW